MGETASRRPGYGERVWLSVVRGRGVARCAMNNITLTQFKRASFYSIIMATKKAPLLITLQQGRDLLISRYERGPVSLHGVNWTEAHRLSAAEWKQLLVNKNLVAIYNDGLVRFVMELADVSL